MKNENIFGMALEKLMSAVKNKYSRKDWGILLGVSEAAISQWINGKTFPASDKLEMIIVVLSGQNLSVEEQEEFDRFMAILETPVKDIWSKIATEFEDKKLSDYILQRDSLAFENNFSFLFYDLKVELFQDVNRQISIHKNHFIKSLLNEKTHDYDSFYEISMKNRRILSEFRNEKQRKYLRSYIYQIKEINQFFNLLLERFLFKIRDPFDNSNLSKDLLLDVYEKYHKKNNVENKNKQNFDISPKNFVKIEPKNAYECELTFLFPDKPEKELINISLGRIEDEKSQNEFSELSKIYLNFGATKDIDNLPEKDSFFFIKAKMNNRDSVGKENKENKIDGQNYALNFDLGSLVETSSEASMPDLKHKFESEFLKRMSIHNTRRDFIKVYLLDANQTNQKYSVEVLGSVAKARQKISSLNNGMVCVIFGELELRNIDNKHTCNEWSRPLVPLINQLGHRNKELKSCFTNINDNSDYEIKNKGGNCMALLIRDCQNTSNSHL